MANAARRRHRRSFVGLSALRRSITLSGRLSPSNPQIIQRHRRSFLAAAAVAMLVTHSDHAFGHGAPIELDFWGGYPPGVARCQRTVARAAARCLRDVIAARQACLTPALEGNACNVPQLNATIATLRQGALNMVGPHCSNLQLQQLGYADLSEAYRDIVDVCRRLDTAASSAVYAPALRAGVVVAVDAPTRGCIATAARATAKLLDFSVRVRQRVLDRIASARLSPSQKRALVTRSGEQIARVGATLGTHMKAECHAPDFAAAYGQEMSQYLTGIAEQAGCHAQYVYVQNGVLCPVARCGNGIQETAEECDDGNAVDGDGCRSDCRRGPCTLCDP